MRKTVGEKEAAYEERLRDEFIECYAAPKVAAFTTGSHDMEDKDLASTKVLARAVLPFAVRHVDCHLQRFPI